MDKYPGVEVAGCNDSFILTFKKLHTVSIVTATIYIAHNSALEFPFLNIL